MGDILDIPGIPGGGGGGFLGTGGNSGSSALSSLTGKDSSGKGAGSTTTQSLIPPELRSLYENSAERITDSQLRNPVGNFEVGSTFGSAPRAPQFDAAQGQIGTSQQIANQPVGSRSLLDTQPTGTQTASRLASRLAPVANQQVGIQHLENAGIQRARGIQDIVGQVPGQFGQTLTDFQSGVDPLQQLAGTVPGTYGDVRGEADPRIANLIGHSDRQVTGANIQDSPAFRAALDAFESTITPTIQNSAALAGLGRSTGLQQSLAAAQAQYLLPVIQGELAREERGIDRGIGTRQFGITTAADLGIQQAQAEERGIGRETDIGQFGLATAADLGLQEALAGERGIQREGQAAQFAAGLESDTGQRLAAREEARIGRELDALRFQTGVEQAAGAQDLSRYLAGIGADERSRALSFEQSQSAIPQLLQLGQLEQNYAQGIEDRDTQDFLRRQALAEQALYQPFGLIAPSAIGQTATSSGKKAGK